VHKNVLFFERFRQRSVTGAVDFIRSVEEKDGKVLVGVGARHNQRIFGHPRTLQPRVGQMLSHPKKFLQILLIRRQQRFGTHQEIWSISFT
jgi:hypothetical protein